MFDIIPDMKHRALFSLAVAAAALSTAAETATGKTVKPISVVDCSKTVLGVGSVDLNYDPGWTWVTNTPGAYVVFEKTLYPKLVGVGVPAAVTSVVKIFAADASGTFEFAQPSGECNMTLVHRVYAADGTELGSPLTAEIAFGAQASAAAVHYDDAADAVQKLVDAYAVLPIAHSVRWTQGAASFVIADTNLTRGGESRILLRGTDEGVASISSTAFCRGDHELSISFLDAQGELLSGHTRTVGFSGRNHFSIILK